MISVLIVDDHPVVREGLEIMLETRKGFKVTGTVDDGGQAVEFCRKRGFPEVVVSDIRMPKMDGFEMIDKLRRHNPEVKVLLLAGMPLGVEIGKAKACGAKGYLPKSSAPDVIAGAILSIAAGGTAFTGDDLPKAAERGVLSDREREVLEYLRIGKTRDEMAIIMGVSVETIKTHVKNLMVKLDAPNAPAIVNRAYELGLVKA